MNKPDTPKPNAPVASPVRPVADPAAGPTANAATNPAVATQPAKSDKSVAKPADGGTMPRPKEIGGPKGPEPTRFGDWERDGRCVDF